MVVEIETTTHLYIERDKTVHSWQFFRASLTNISLTPQIGLDTAGHHPQITLYIYQVLTSYHKPYVNMVGLLESLLECATLSHENRVSRLRVVPKPFLATVKQSNNDQPAMYNTRFHRRLVKIVC